MKLKTLVPGICIGAVLAAGLTFGVTEASATGPNVTYYACLDKGKLGDVGTTAPTCKAGETQISWNSQGPPGTNGTALDVGSVYTFGSSTGFYSNGLKGWVSVVNETTGVYCLVPDPSTNESNGSLVLSPGGPGSFVPGEAVYQSGYCFVNDNSTFGFQVVTYVNGTVANAPFTAIVP
jgi:hypothetical protein